MVPDRLKEIRTRISNTARRSGRDPHGIRLVAVAKGQPIEKIREAIEEGQVDFGENYAQELLAHVGAALRGRPETGRHRDLPQQINWHFIGHLQRNKVKQIIDKIALIHSVDSLELAQEIDRRTASIDKIQPILIEVNLGGEGSKTGIQPEKVKELVQKISQLKGVALNGLMTIPPFFDNPEQVRPYFRRLREICKEMNLSELSMGMTHDFEVAIEEGATIVRIGTGIFGERKK